MGGLFDPSICPTMPVRTCQYLATQRSMQLFSPTFRSASLYLHHARTTIFNTKYTKTIE
ncbi:hypothetical protein M758_2G221400 [Ceratodon purpureus]|nr:hypothetical protein M758_2G221400 [Ceratodon purpureus]